MTAAAQAVLNQINSLKLTDADLVAIREDLRKTLSRRKAIRHEQKHPEIYAVLRQGGGAA